MSKLIASARIRRFVLPFIHVSLTREHILGAVRKTTDDAGDTMDGTDLKHITN